MKEQDPGSPTPPEGATARKGGGGMPKLPWYWREHLIRVYESTGMHEWAEVIRMAEA